MISKKLAKTLLLIWTGLCAISIILLFIPSYLFPSYISDNLWVFVVILTPLSIYLLDTVLTENASQKNMRKFRKITKALIKISENCDYDEILRDFHEYLRVKFEKGKISEEIYREAEKILHKN